MLAFTSKSNTLRLGRFRSWAVRPYLHKKVNTTFLTRCCLYIIAYLSAYLRLWGAWVVAYSILFSRDRIIIHAFYWRFPLVKGRHSRYGLCWLSNHYVPCLSRVKTKREFLYNQVPIAYTTSRKFMTQSITSYQALKSRLSQIRKLAAQAPQSPLMHPEITGLWDARTHNSTRWNARARARALRHKLRRAPRIAHLAVKWSKPMQAKLAPPTPIYESATADIQDPLFAKVMASLRSMPPVQRAKPTKIIPQLSILEQTEKVIRKGYRRFYPRKPIRLFIRHRNRAYRQIYYRERYRRPSGWSLVRHRKHIKKLQKQIPWRTPATRTKQTRYSRDPLALAIPVHHYNTLQQQHRIKAKLKLQSQLSQDFSRYQLTSRRAFAQRGHWVNAIRSRKQSTVPTSTNQQLSRTSWLRSYTRHTQRKPSMLSHWNLTQFAQFRHLNNQRFYLSPTRRTRHTRQMHTRKVLQQKRFIFGRPVLTSTHSATPIKRPRHTRLALVTAANWRFAPLQTVPFILVHRTSKKEQLTTILVTKKIKTAAKNYVKREERREEQRGKQRARIDWDHPNSVRARSQRSNIRYYQQIEAVAREIRRLRWRKRQTTRRKSAKAFALARLLLQPQVAFTSQKKVRHACRLTPTNTVNGTQINSIATNRTTSRASRKSSLVARSREAQVANYLRLSARQSRSARRARTVRKKITRAQTKNRLFKNKRDQWVKQYVVPTLTLRQKIPTSRILLPLPTVIGLLGAKAKSRHLNYSMMSHALVSSLYNQTLRFLMARAWTTNYTTSLSQTLPIITNVNSQKARPTRAGTRYRGRSQSFSKFKTFQSYLTTRLKLAVKAKSSTFAQV